MAKMDKSHIVQSDEAFYEDRKGLEKRNHFFEDNGITEEIFKAFNNVISIHLDQWQIDQLIYPKEVYPNQTTVLSVHWHPEFIPFELIQKRLHAMFPKKETEFFVPTQHNVLLSYDQVYSGVEIDCYSPEFDRKVQLLCHFHNKNVQQAHTFKSMLNHTYKYRAGQLYEFIDTILEKTYEGALNQAVIETGATQEVIQFTRSHVEMLKKLIFEYQKLIPAETLRNKLVRNFIEEIGSGLDPDFMNRVQAFLTAIKGIVKKRFSPKNFFTTQEFIEEVRGLNGGIIIPHPEQFWPILLAGYDIDGVEVWNPQSNRYTKFLINVIKEKNERKRKDELELLVVMGDDCHFSEKVKPLEKQSKEKSSRQVGLQPWEDLDLQKGLIKANATKKYFIDEYTKRLNG